MKSIVIAIASLLIGTQATASDVLSQIPKDAECIISYAPKWNIRSFRSVIYPSHNQRTTTKTVVVALPVKFKLTNGRARLANVSLELSSSQSEWLDGEGMLIVPNRMTDPTVNRLVSQATAELNSTLSVVGLCN